MIGLLDGVTVPVPDEDLILGWRTVAPDLRSSHGYRYPFPGQWATCDPGVKKLTTIDPCPQFPGDGLCVARTWQGASSGGTPARCALLVAYRPADVLAADDHKVRVRSMYVLDVLDVPRLLREGMGAGANLTRANLTGANLTRADLYGADLTGADLYGADLTRADLYGANLTRANLARADLYGANLTRADLYGANLTRADLYGANLTRANLTRADLTRADLYGANLTRAKGDTYTVLPPGYTVADGRVVAS